MDILAAIRERFTTQSFDGRPIDSDVLDRILEAGRLAPSAKNRQTWRFIAIKKPEIKQVLSNACFGDARILKSGCIIAACTTNIQYIMPNGQPSYPLDIAFAVSYMDLQATHEGLATAIVSSYDEQAVKSLLTTPYSMRVVLMLAVGHSSEKKAFKKRFPSDRLISYDHW
ncbi:MAG: nitroreductase [spirochete symbiont of Stewartia floridana]|nr:MAG: nitroreductase [spirochete symbiont of Stewartia floridana]